jgi:hypothetical protein
MARSSSRVVRDGRRSERPNGPSPSGEEERDVNLGRLIVAFGIVLVVLGLAIQFVPALRLGRLPGDLSFGGAGWRVYLPIGTSILLSIVLSLAFALFSMLSRR